MKYMHSEWRDRLENWIHALAQDLYLPLGPLPVEAFETAERLSPAQAAGRRFAPLAEGSPWGDGYAYCWMRGSVTLPEEAKGKRIVLDLPTGGETSVFVDGLSFGTYRASGMDEPHHYLVDNALTRDGQPGRRYDILLEAYAGHYFPQSPLAACATGPVLPGSYQDPLAGKKRAVLGRLSFGIWNEEAYQLYLDLKTLWLLCCEQDPESLRADKLAKALEQATLLLDFEQPPEGRLQGYRAARALLAPLLAAHNGSTAPRFYAIGNAHLDLAWLWTMEETYRKTSRTFAAQLRLLEEYPDYKFLQSQPASYAMCRELYPELYQRIRQAAKAGRWIAEGAMWVEPDTNMTSGESLVRQLLHGKRFFREEFGVDSVVLWLPDSFGYSAALPQLLRGSGVKYLVTQKIFWSYNEGDRFPYHYFSWQGADGSAIDTFLPTSYTYRTHPKEICQAWKGRVQKRGLDAFLLPFGYGDGGGGPSRDHVEYLLRERDLEGMPRVEMEGPVRFFQDMEAAGGPEQRYVGELYFSAHRGVYTSQAQIKRGNRKAELALREAEHWGALAGWLQAGYAYPLAEMDASWKLLLLNQFHDILPGSSIGPVYEKARSDHRRVQQTAGAVAQGALAALAQGEGVTAFNSLSFARSCLIPLPEAFANGALTQEGERLAVQRTAAGLVALVELPPCGTRSLLPAPPASQVSQAKGARASLLPGGGALLENELVCAQFNDRAELVSFQLLSSGREFAAGPMNRLAVYKDVPRLFDAWDIDSNYALQPVALQEPVELSLLETGGLVALLRVRRRLLDSSLEQEIRLEAGSPRLDFVTHVEWRELHRLLKVCFPVDVQATEGYNEIQYGYLARPTHRSRPYDSDRFEVCNQRYSALCDASHGAAVLNDCKYGISMNGNELQLSLLRASASPEMRADNGSHDFTYAFTAWEGDFLHSPVVDQAYCLNVPPQLSPGFRPPLSAFGLSAPNVYIDAVKPAEDGSGDIVLRLYEAKRADTHCQLRLGLDAKAVWLCDLLENKQQPLQPVDGQYPLHFHTFEVKTLRLCR